MLPVNKSNELLIRARRRIPGGVNSPVRAWEAVGGAPLFIERAAGARLYDADGNSFIDYVGSFGPTILGHGNPNVISALTRQFEQGLSYGAPTRLEVELAERITSAIPAAKKVRLVNSGTEAAMTALRVARAATGRPGVIKFDGCYHGHTDFLLVRAGSGAMTFGVPDSAGVPEAVAAQTRIAPFGSLEAVERYFSAEPSGIAAVIVEPVAANMGVVPPPTGFLRSLQELARHYHALLICDEVITGFRLCYGSISETLGIEPDLIMLGKIIGGGMPIGAVAGRAELMDLLAPEGPVYQAGTLSGNPVSVTAGIETLRALEGTANYKRLEAFGARLEAGFRDALVRSGRRGCVNRAGSLLTLFLGIDQVGNADDARKADTAAFARFFRTMIERGIYLPPSQFEALFISLAHTEADIDTTITAAGEALRELGAS
ncbi:MAG TPA: glutamate-1-semialdehyde 2,1-aminomutase [Candidatus Binataceae bacterium]|nr:glutamate-1-semialdehyde 2,1-aminomutase [Candidatus Binataceae bacterium]